MSKMLELNAILTSTNKKPLTKFDEAITLRLVADQPNIGLIVPKNVVVFDFDDLESFNTVLKICRSQYLTICAMRSSRGGHIWFKSNKPLKNVIGVFTPLTIKTDVRSYGKNSFVLIKHHNIWRKWEEWQEDLTKLSEVPHWLRPLKYKNMIPLLGLGDGDGRNAELNRIQIPLANEGHSIEKRRVISNLINEHIFKTPLSDAEINNMLADKANNVFVADQFFTEKGKFLNNVFANWLSTQLNIFFHQGAIWYYSKGAYTKDERVINQLMLGYFPNLTSFIRAEVIKTLALTDPDRIEIPRNIVSFRNINYDYKYDLVKQHTPDLLVTNQLDCDYVADAYDEHIDKFLNWVSCNDKQVRAVIEEALGYTLLGDSRFQKAFIFLGAGSNGKSTLMNAWQATIGRDNYSAVSLTDLNSRFRVSQLIGKLVNTADDISSKYMTDTSNAKKIITGDKITLEDKYANPFMGKVTAKMMFNANKLPMSDDKTYGFIRRFIIIPMNNTITPNSPDYDANMEDRLTTESAKSYLALVAINGLKRLLKNRKFTKADAIEKEELAWAISNNTVRQYAMYRGEKMLKGMGVYQLFTDYCSWANVRGIIHKFSFDQFTSYLLTDFKNLEIKNEKVVVKNANN